MVILELSMGLCYRASAHTCALGLGPSRHSGTDQTVGAALPSSHLSQATSDRTDGLILGAALPQASPHPLSTPFPMYLQWL